ncbi:MAG: isopentenyl phosphate kinase family protein [Anaerolineales bacterium]|nr:isopentenyl phosphate kinase family protein [Anaerolineales bacterium]
MTNSPPLTFLKLGGSLITDKHTPSTALPGRIRQLSGEIAEFKAQSPAAKLLLGHGSGSFGHVPGKKFGTREGVHTPDQWRGFAEVWRQAKTLNQIVADGLHQAGLPAVVFPAVSSAAAADGQITHWDLSPIQQALEHGLLPVVYGDVAFDSVRGGTIVSTENIFNYLARELKPNRILIAGIEKGVWADFPACTKIIDQITPENLEAVLPDIRGSAATDVTGGMSSKVREMCQLASQVSGLEVHIFSALQPGSLLAALTGKLSGTKLTGF